MKKVIRYITFCLFFTIIINEAIPQQRIDLLLKDRQKLYGTFIMRMDGKVFRDSSIVGIINQIAEYDQSIAAEMAIIDSVMESNHQKIGLLQSINTNFESEKQKVKTTLWIFIGFSIVLFGATIYLLLSWLEVKNRLIFLKTDIDETNRNFLRLTNEKSEREESLKNEILETRKKIEYYETQLKNSRTESERLREKAIEVEKKYSALLTRQDELMHENQSLSQQILLFRKGKENLTTPEPPVYPIQEPLATTPPPVQTPQSLTPPPTSPVESKESVIEAAQRILHSITANGKGSSIADESFFSSIQQSGKNAMMDDSELSEAQKSLMELEVNLHKIAKIKVFKEKGILSETEYEELKQRIFSHL